MKKFLLTLGLLASFAFAPVAEPKAEAQVVQWQCNYQTYCNPYTGICFQRVQCCAWVTDAWGYTHWRCEWR